MLVVVAVLTNGLVANVLRSQRKHRTSNQGEILSTPSIIKFYRGYLSNYGVDRNFRLRHLADSL